MRASTFGEEVRAVVIVEVRKDPQQGRFVCHSHPLDHRAQSWRGAVAHATTVDQAAKNQVVSSIAVVVAALFDINAPELDLRPVRRVWLQDRPLLGDGVIVLVDPHRLADGHGLDLTLLQELDTVRLQTCMGALHDLVGHCMFSDSRLVALDRTSPLSTAPSQQQDRPASANAHTATSKTC